jgi:hypothetical protein
MVVCLLCSISLTVSGIGRMVEEISQEGSRQQTRMQDAPKSMSRDVSSRYYIMVVVVSSGSSSSSSRLYYGVWIDYD